MPPARLSVHGTRGRLVRGRPRASGEASAGDRRLRWPASSALSNPGRTEPFLCRAEGLGGRGRRNGVLFTRSMRCEPSESEEGTTRRDEGNDS